MTIDQIRLIRREKNEREAQQKALDFIKFDRLTANAFPLNISEYADGLPRGQAKNFYSWVRERTQSGALSINKDMQLVRLQDSSATLIE